MLLSLSQQQSAQQLVGQNLNAQQQAISGVDPNEELVHHRFFDAYKKMRILGKIIESLDSKSFLDKETFNSRYNKEIIEVRNELAHCIEEEKDGKKFLVTSKGESKYFDDTDFSVMRKNLIDHYDNLVAIEAAL